MEKRCWKRLWWMTWGLTSAQWGVLWKFWIPSLVRQHSLVIRIWLWNRGSWLNFCNNHSQNLCLRGKSCAVRLCLYSLQMVRIKKKFLQSSPYRPMTNSKFPSNLSGTYWGIFINSIQNFLLHIHHSCIPSSTCLDFWVTQNRLYANVVLHQEWFSCLRLSAEENVPHTFGQQHWHFRYIPRTQNAYLHTPRWSIRAL
jgi:hypothetical protein